MKHLFAHLLVVSVGCGTGVHSNPGMPPDGQPPGDAPPETQRLGMNDISFVAATIDPLPERKLTGISAPRDLVPRDLYARLATSHGDIINDFEDFMMFGIRFDLCDRVATGPCPEGADGSLRVVFQPRNMQGFVVAEDVGLHAFYSIPAAELGFVVNELRAIARLNDVVNVVNLGLSEPLSGTGEGIQRMDALLETYVNPDRLIRLALMGQDARSSTPHVVFRGLELHDGQWTDLRVAGLDATQQDAILTDTDPSYAVTPVADSPAGFALTLSSGSFNAAAPADQRDALDALVATQNPLLHTSATVQCIDCHVSTYLAVHRAQVAVVGLGTLPSRFATTREVRISEGISATTPASLHAFGWLGTDIAISQRVINETAMVLDEIEQRFPVP